MRVYKDIDKCMDCPFFHHIFNDGNGKAKSSCKETLGGWRTINIEDITIIQDWCPFKKKNLNNKLKKVRNEEPSRGKRS